MALYLREADVDALLTPADAVDAVEACFNRIGREETRNPPRVRVPLPDGLLHVMPASDHELGVSGVKTYVRVAGHEGPQPVVCLYGADRPDLLAVIEARRLGQLRTGAASAVAARHLARDGARSLGLIGCGHQAETQFECIRLALAAINQTVVYCREEKRRKAFAQRFGAEAGEYNRDAAEQDVVVTVTTSRDPVLRGEWLHPGALVCAVGANRLEARELDNAVVERATFVCCDSAAQARIEAGDLVEPVERGVLDWLEVHELGEVVTGAVTGRQGDDDVVLFKSVGIAVEDLAVAKLALDRAAEAGRGARI